MWLPWKQLQGPLCSSEAESLSGFPLISQRSCLVLTSHRPRRGSGRGSKSWSSSTEVPKKASLAAQDLSAGRRMASTQRMSVRLNNEFVMNRQIPITQ
ncbi:uncharacterized [Tachysurus ichikawai]